MYINTDVTPIAQNDQHIPFHLHEALAKELDSFFEWDIIDPAESATPRNSPLVVVHKQKGTHVCVDSLVSNVTIE